MYADKGAVKVDFGQAKLDSNEITDELVDQKIKDASLQVDIDKVPSRYQEYATRVYACHLLTLYVSAAKSTDNGLVLEQVGGLKQQYSAYSGSKQAYSNRFEEAYDKLLRSLGLSGNIGEFI